MANLLYYKMYLARNEAEMYQYNHTLNRIQMLSQMSRGPAVLPVPPSAPAVALATPSTQQQHGRAPDPPGEHSDNKSNEYIELDIIKQTRKDYFEVGEERPIKRQRLPTERFLYSPPKLAYADAAELEKMQSRVFLPRSEESHRLHHYQQARWYSSLQQNTTSAGEAVLLAAKASKDMNPGYPHRRTVSIPRPFEVHYQELIDFKERFGHVDVPQRWKENPRLGRWVKNIRQKSWRLTDEQRKRLDDIGLQWKLKKAPPSIKQQEAKDTA